MKVNLPEARHLAAQWRERGGSVDSDCAAERLTEALDDVEQAEKDRLAPWHYESNGEDGDGQMACDICGNEIINQHTWEECARGLSKQVEYENGAHYDALHNLEVSQKWSRANHVCAAKWRERAQKSEAETRRCETCANRFPFCETPGGVLVWCGHWCAPRQAGHYCADWRLKT